MKIEHTKLSGVYILHPAVHHDLRGMFFESFNVNKFLQLTNTDVTFVQDNQSISYKNVLRGLHYQQPNGQGKLVRVTHGSVFDVAVDIRKDSLTFGQWVGVELSEENKKQLWIPDGFAHGFLALTNMVTVQYKVTEYYDKASEKSIRWNDPTINIKWPLTESPILSEKDAAAPLLNDIQML
jgi:dTDP-4-dehydrorhamnose 3,5-epimerase